MTASAPRAVPDRVEDLSSTSAEQLLAWLEGEIPGEMWDLVKAEVEASHDMFGYAEDLAYELEIIAGEDGDRDSLRADPKYLGALLALAVTLQIIEANPGHGAEDDDEAFDVACAIDRDDFSELCMGVEPAFGRVGLERRIPRV